MVKSLLFSVLFLFNTLLLSAQEEELPRKYTRALDRADMLYSSFVFKQAIDQYQKVLNIGKHDSAEVYLRIADSYRLINKNEEALRYYDIVDNLNVMTRQDLSNYAQELILGGDYIKAKMIADSLGTSLARLKNSDLVNEIRIDTAAYFLENLVVNGKDGDFSPAYFEDGIVFVSNREWKRLLQNKYYWDETFFLDLYYTQNVDSTAEYFSRFSKRINSIYHEGPATFYFYDTKVIFTRNNFNQGRKQLSSDGINKLKLYSSEKPVGQKDWSKPVELWFNDDNYSVGHPTVTSNGKRLYFASDMPGTLGEADIFYSDLVEGEWAKPINMGDVINTETDELFPFIYQDSILYFASKGHLGLGALDIYRINLNNPNDTPDNMGSPLNSKYDDFGLIQKGNVGYFSSNRPGGKGGDDIYRFTYTQIIPPIPSYIVSVKAIDSETLEHIPGSIVFVEDLYNPDTVVYEENIGDIYYFETLENQSYYARGVKSDYFANEISFEIGEDLGVDTLFYEIPLEKIVVGKAIELENIYYDVNKSDIRPDAAIELDKLLKILKDNPEISIELSSHTDSRGSDPYNQKLSQRRAESAVAYIVSKGIDAERIAARGYGEERLVNRCSNGVNCSKDEHQVNRRTEFAVTDTGG